MSQSQSESKTGVHALIGAIVTVFLSFTFVSPILGGAVAGYLEGTNGIRIGALSGAIAALPVVVFGLIALPFFLTGTFVIGLVFTLFVVLSIAGWAVGLGALGGYLGVYLRTEWQ